MVCREADGGDWWIHRFGVHASAPGPCCPGLAGCPVIIHADTYHSRWKVGWQRNRYSHSLAPADNQPLSDSGTWRKNHDASLHIQISLEVAPTSTGWAFINVDARNLNAMRQLYAYFTHGIERDQQGEIAWPSTAYLGIRIPSKFQRSLSRSFEARTLKPLSLASLVFSYSIFLVNQTPGRNLNPPHSCFPLSKHGNVIDELAAGYLPTSMSTWLVSRPLMQMYESTRKSRHGSCRYAAPQFAHPCICRLANGDGIKTTDVDTNWTTPHSFWSKRLDLGHCIDHLRPFFFFLSCLLSYCAAKSTFSNLLLLANCPSSQPHSCGSVHVAYFQTSTIPHQAHTRCRYRSLISDPIRGTLPPVRVLLSLGFYLSLLLPPLDPSPTLLTCIICSSRTLHMPKYLLLKLSLVCG
ncbi:uncharacterized protein CLUP02_06203 [Colletotrichum lupini]|uniref:Uncharacterized protein n=1 Tax=Colletotrichum lupini TaxID=145971 RepID=A0A9Q8SP81_9PEZI|nr:uncharacterized protein CLUP02_06203 [Colletotrichum lupini]UQC80718.1 hypothetical protein CLUP02_06203 [Colletotrichum lupini]